MFLKLQRKKLLKLKRNKENKMLTPQERYYRDPEFKRLVDVMVSMIHKANFTPTELREAAILAAIIYETSVPHWDRRLKVKDEGKDI